MSKQKRRVSILAGALAAVLLGIIPGTGSAATTDELQTQTGADEVGTASIVAEKNNIDRQVRAVCTEPENGNTQIAAYDLLIDDEQTAKQLEMDIKQAKADLCLYRLEEKSAELGAAMPGWEAGQESLGTAIAARELEYDAAWREEYGASALSEAPEDHNGGESSGEAEGEENEVDSWIIPCDYVCVTDTFGWRIHPIGGYESFHNGIDLAGWYGTPICASRSGVVTTATYHWSFGDYVTIDHGDGYSSVYAHMTYFIVSEGAWVEQGEVIGYMGSTGESTADHLHFGVYENGDAIDPESLIDFQ